MRRKFSELWVVFLPSFLQQTAIHARISFPLPYFGNAMCSTFRCVCVCACDVCACVSPWLWLPPGLLPACSGSPLRRCAEQRFPRLPSIQALAPHACTHTHTRAHAQSLCPVHPHAAYCLHHLQPRSGGGHSSAANRAAAHPALRRQPSQPPQPRDRFSFFFFFLIIFIFYYYFYFLLAGDSLLLRRRGDEAAALPLPPCAHVCVCAPTSPPPRKSLPGRSGGFRPAAPAAGGHGGGATRKRGTCAPRHAGCAGGWALGPGGAAAAAAAAARGRGDWEQSAELRRGAAGVQRQGLQLGQRALPGDRRYGAGRDAGSGGEGLWGLGCALACAARSGSAGQLAVPGGRRYVWW